MCAHDSNNLLSLFSNIINLTQNLKAFSNHYETKQKLINCNSVWLGLYDIICVPDKRFYYLNIFLILIKNNTCLERELL
jgi:hypothetical protein